MKGKNSVDLSYAARPLIEISYHKRRYGLMEYIRRLREEPQPLIEPEISRCNLIGNRFCCLDTFLIDMPEYIDHMFALNQSHYVKIHVIRAILGLFRGNRPWLSEIGFWRWQRRITSFAYQSIHVFLSSHTAIVGLEALVACWRGKQEPVRNICGIDKPAAKRHRPHHFLK